MPDNPTPIWIKWIFSCFFCPKPHLKHLFIYVINVSDIFKIYCADHTYVTLKLRMDTTVDGIIKHASSKLGLGDVNLTLCEVKSNGGYQRFIFHLIQTLLVLHLDEESLLNFLLEPLVLSWNVLPHSIILNINCLHDLTTDFSSKGRIVGIYVSRFDYR